MTTTAPCPCETETLRSASEGDVVIVEDAPQSGVAAWAGPIGIEGYSTGDGRTIASNSLRWDTLPMPLRWAREDYGEHSGAVVVGLIERIERLSADEANERLQAAGKPPLDLPDGATVVWGAGTYDIEGTDGKEAFRQLKAGLTPGISMDLDDVVIREDMEDVDAFTVEGGRIRAATQVAIPAFEGARISVSDPETFTKEAAEPLRAALTAGGTYLEVSEDLFNEAIASGQATVAGVREEDGVVIYDLAFNWVDDAGGLPEYIKRIKKHLEKKGMPESQAVATAVNVVKKMCATGDLNFPGSQQVNAGSRAEACAAVADWEQKKAKAKADSAESLVASAGSPVFPFEWFENPRLTGPTPLTVTEDGRVFGHVAAWDSCHIANPQGPNVCTRPPHSKSNYSYFKTGAVSTTKGDIAVGKITVGTLHAGARLSSSDTVYHYEHTGTVGAYVNAGEDAYGIWVAGAAHPSVDRLTLKGAPISGDWRTIGGSLEMVGALSVNIPGFPIPRAEALVAGGQVKSLVASGVVTEARLAKVETAFDRGRRRAKAAALARRVDRAVKFHKVRLTREVLAGRLAFQTKTAAFEAKDQWRVPKGNGRESGRFIDMPDNLLGGFESKLRDALETSDADDNTLADIGDSLDNAMAKAKQAGDALRAGDGPGAKKAAADLDDELGVLNSQLENLADSGALDDPEGIGADFANVRASVDAINDSDLSLLGDKGIGGDAPGTDIGGEDKSVVGDVPAAPKKDKALKDLTDDELNDRADKASTVEETRAIADEYKRRREALPGGNEPADGGAGDAAEPMSTAEASDDIDALESNLQALADGPAGDDDRYVDMADAFVEAQKGFDSNDPDKYEQNLNKVESILQDMADDGTIDEDTAANIGDAIEKTRISAGIGGTRNNAPDPNAPADGGAGDAAEPLSTAEASDDFDALESNLQALADGPAGDDPRMEDLGAALEDASAAIDANDPDGYDTALNTLESNLQSMADEGLIDEDTAANIGDALEKARVSGGLGATRNDGDGPDAESPAEDVNEPKGPRDIPNPDEPADGGANDAAEPDSGGGPLPDSNGEGSAQQRAGNEAVDAMNALETTLIDSVESEAISEDDAAAIGDALQEFTAALDTLNNGIQDGAYNADDLTKAQSLLSGLESQLMAVADKPGWTDDEAANIGQMLDDMFAKLGNLAGLLQGSMEPPPFARRKYVRQWLGRRGIRLDGRHSLI